MPQRSLRETVLAAAALCLAATAAPAAEDIAQHDLAGAWHGEAVFLLPDGVTHQQHSWAIPAENLKSHDGRQFTYNATGPFLGVVGLEGELWLTEIGDDTIFVLRLVDADTLAFIGLEGDGHPAVGRGELKRE
jgi:hypothetical protein